MEAQLRVQRVYEPLDARIRGICSRFEPLQPQGIVASSEPHNVLDHTKHFKGDNNLPSGYFPVVNVHLL